MNDGVSVTYAIYISSSSVTYTNGTLFCSCMPPVDGHGMAQGDEVKLWDAL